jgi:MFS family permease
MLLTILTRVIIHVNIVIYAACYWIQQPVLPFLSTALGADQVSKHHPYLLPVPLANLKTVRLTHPSTSLPPTLYHVPTHDPLLSPAGLSLTPATLQVVFGQLVSTISALSLVGGPMLGWLTDRKGAKVCSLGALLHPCLAPLCWYEVSVYAPAIAHSLAHRSPQVAMLVSQLASIVMYGTMWQATSLPWLFASRVPSLFQHAMMCAQV